MSLKSRVVAVLAENGYEDLELWYPLLRMREEGAEVVVVGPGTSDVYLSKHGYEVKVDKNVEEIDVKDFDAVLIPGGTAPDRLRRYPPVVNFVREAFKQGKVVGAICHAASVLVSAKILKDRTVTCFMSIKDDVENAGATYVDQEVVRDGNLITSRVPKDLPAFCLEIISTLIEEEQ